MYKIRNFERLSLFLQALTADVSTVAPAGNCGYVYSLKEVQIELESNGKCSSLAKLIEHPCIDPCAMKYSTT